MATAQAQMKTTERKYLTIDDLENSPTTAVWVSNTTDRGGLEAGRLIMSVPKVHGQGIDIVRIPKTFIPINLTEQVPKKQLIDSSEFRKTVQMGHLRIWNPKWAAIVLAQDESKEELRRVENEMRMSKAAAEAAMVTGADNEEDEYFDPEDTSAGKTAAASKMAKAVEADQTEKIKAKASAKVQQLAADAINANAPQARVIAMLRNVSKMNEVDLKYLARQFKDKPKVTAYLKERYKTLAKKAA